MPRDARTEVRALDGEEVMINFALGRLTGAGGLLLETLAEDARDILVLRETTMMEPLRVQIFQAMTTLPKTILRTLLMPHIRPVRIAALLGAGLATIILYVASRPLRILPEEGAVDAIPIFEGRM